MTPNQQTAERIVAAIRAKGYFDEGLLEHPAADESAVLDGIAAIVEAVPSERSQAVNCHSCGARIEFPAVPSERDAKCICGGLQSQHSWHRDHWECEHCYSNDEPCTEFRPAGERDIQNLMYRAFEAGCAAALQSASPQAVQGLSAEEECHLVKAILHGNCKGEILHREATCDAFLCLPELRPEHYALVNITLNRDTLDAILRAASPQPPCVNGMDAQLCYVKHGFAYFTTQPINMQWGDDWNDAPYEHNAGEPYGPLNEKDGRTWQIFKLVYECDVETPAERANSNSHYSVEQINAGAVAWLTADEWANHKTVIKAGTTMRDFIEKIQSAGGTVYTPLPEPPSGKEK